MEKALVFTLLLLFTLATKHRLADGQAIFCRSQINLANEACSLLNIPGRRPPLPAKLNETSSSTATAAADGSGAVLGIRSRDDEDDDEGEGGEEHHGHRHRHSTERDPYDTACCRRLMALENSCVCQVFGRLPAFLTSVWHVVRLRPIDGCDVSFECPGSFSRLG